jgi:hypothetical protein
MRAAPFVLLLIATAAGAPPGGGAPRTLRYDLRAGDHLVYRLTVTREVRTPQEEVTTRLLFEGHVLATAERDGKVRVGFQRNRTSAEVVSAREKGKDRTADERPRFAERLARRPSWSAEGNVIGSDGWGWLPWSAVREAGGELVPSLRELPALPRAAVDGSSRWRGDDDVGVVFRAAGDETRGSEPCLRIDGEDEGGGLASGQPGASIRFWHCASGVVSGLEAEARYLAPPEQQIHEQVEIALVARRRGEEARTWLADPAVQRGALASLLASDALPRGLGAPDLHALLASPDAAVQRQALAVLYRHGLAAPPAARLGELEHADDRGVRELATRLAAPEAAADARFLALARTVREGGFAADWRCGEDADWAHQALFARRAWTRRGRHAARADHARLRRAPLVARPRSTAATSRSR